MVSANTLLLITCWHKICVKVFFTKNLQKRKRHLGVLGIKNYGCAVNIGFLPASPRRVCSSTTPLSSRSLKVTSISSSLLWMDCYPQKQEKVTKEFIQTLKTEHFHKMLHFLLVFMLSFCSSVTIKLTFRMISL